MTAFVLVHGAWHGGWCWHKVKDRLESMGHTVYAPDMPGHGEDPQPIAKVTLDDIVRRVCGTMDQSREQVVLVGHSYGGAMITQAAEYCPGQVKSLVFLTAFLLENGKSLMDMSQLDADSHLAGKVDIAPDQSTASVQPDALRDCFYAQCSDEDFDFAARGLNRDEAVAGLATPVKTSAPKFGSLPRYYIECLKDNAISIDMQRRMHAAQPCQRVYSLDTDHSPFFSTPDTLAKILSRIAA
ncbi:MAG: alpha/beta fold hydrolase [Alphaproteobacteria bacterium]|nr:alpha/beta fold hydrolase [Alphaproteobacteria bacterium]